MGEDELPSDEGSDFFLGLMVPSSSFLLSSASSCCFPFLCSLRSSCDEGGEILIVGLFGAARGAGGRESRGVEEEEERERAESRGGAEEEARAAEEEEEDDAGGRGVTSGVLLDAAGGTGEAAGDGFAALSNAAFKSIGGTAFVGSPAVAVSEGLVRGFFTADPGASSSSSSSNSISWSSLGLALSLAFSASSSDSTMSKSSSS